MLEHKRFALVLAYDLSLGRTGKIAQKNFPVVKVLVSFTMQEKLQNKQSVLGINTCHLYFHSTFLFSNPKVLHVAHGTLHARPVMISYHEHNSHTYSKHIIDYQVI